MRKSLFLIGGTPGTGKTSLSRALCHRLEIDHRISTGFIREVVRDQTSREQFPDLFRSTFRAPDPVSTLLAQAKILERPVRRCIERARQEGTSLIIEGAHVLPSIYNTTPCHSFVILAAPPAPEHTERLLGTTHLCREVTAADVAGARTIDAFLQHQAMLHDVPYLPCNDAIDRILSR